MEEMTRLEKTLNFFEEMNVILPTEVHNSIEDAFEMSDDIESIDIYFLQDQEAFTKDLILTNEVKAYLDKPSEGNTVNVFTLSGEVEYSLSEYVVLYDSNNEEVERITNIDRSNTPTKILNNKKYIITMIEEVSWKDGEIDYTPRLYIYCPELIEE